MIFFSLLMVIGLASFDPEMIHMWNEADGIALSAADTTDIKPDFLSLKSWYIAQLEVSNSSMGCWKKSYGRGVGVPLSQCPNADKSGLLCYPYCPPNMDGVGPVCWENCKPGYTNDGLTCRKNARIYSSDHSSCPWYDVCGLTFSKGCSNCNAHPGAKNDGCTCRYDVDIYGKSAKGRGVGWPMSCRPTEDQSGALCYPPCHNSMSGVGPVCWSTCPGKGVDCGAFCAKSTTECIKTIGYLSKFSYKAVEEILDNLDNGTIIKGIIQTYNLTESMVDTITEMGWC